MRGSRIFRILFVSWGLFSGLQNTPGQNAPAQGPVKVRLLASLPVAGNMTDLSGLTGNSGEGIPANRFGGWGSGIAQGTEKGSYWLVSDRGPNDGASTFKDRMHLVQLNWENQKISFKLKKTVLLKDEKGRGLVGDKSEILSGLRFDPESIRIIPTPKGQRILISDEYGPDIREFNENGKQTSQFAVPEYFRVKSPDKDPELETKNNKEGRVPNKGFEGMALDGTRLVVANQGSLIQDIGEKIEGVAKKGTLLRFLVFDTETRKPQGEFLYSLDDPKNGVSELIHWEKDKFLVLERDSLAGLEAKSGSKCIYVVDLSKARMMPLAARIAEGKSRKEAFLEKNLLVDLTQMGIPAEKIPAKWEGMAWGPRLPSGNRLLWVTADNDFVKEKSSWIYALEIGNR